MLFDWLVGDAFQFDTHLLRKIHSSRVKFTRLNCILLKAFGLPKADGSKKIDYARQGQPEHTEECPLEKTIERYGDKKKRKKSLIVPQHEKLNAPRTTLFGPRLRREHRSARSRLCPRGL